MCDQPSPLSLLLQEAEKGAWKRTRTSERCRLQQRRTDELCSYLAAWCGALWCFCFFYIFNGIKNVNIWNFSMGRGIGLEQDHSCLRQWMEQIWTFFSGAVCTDGRCFFFFAVLYLKHFAFSVGQYCNNVLPILELVLTTRMRQLEKVPYPGRVVKDAGRGRADAFIVGAVELIWSLLWECENWKNNSILNKQRSDPF